MIPIFVFSQKPEKQISFAQSDKLNNIDQFLTTHSDSSGFMGYVIISKGDSVIYEKGFGYSDIDNNIPFTRKTQACICSTGKLFTSLLIMKLVQENKISLEDKIGKYFPELPFGDSVTIKHLLTHTSGIPYGWDQKAYVDSLYRVTGAGGWEGTIGEKVKIIAGLPLKHQPGTKWEYGLSIDVAGYLIEVLSGMPLDVYFKTKIFDPLKMDDSGFYVPEEKHNRLSVLFSVREGNLMGAEGQMSKAFKSPVTLFSGGGGLVSTIDDYAKFCRMMLNGGELGGVQILDESTVKIVMTNQLPVGAKYTENAGYGLAGSVNLETGEYGWAGAASTKFWLDAENEMIIFAFAQLMPSNYSFADDFKKIVDKAVIKN